MALTRAGKALAMCTVGGGVINSTSNTLERVQIKNMNGTTYCIATSINSSYTQDNNGYKYPTYLCLGSDLITDQALGVYGMANKQVYKIKAYEGSPNPVNIPYMDVESGITRLTISITNSSDTNQTFRYYGMVVSTGGLAVFTSINSGSSTTTNTGYVLLSYYQFPEPIVVQPGETKTIQITIDVSNL